MLFFRDRRVFSTRKESENSLEGERLDPRESAMSIFLFPLVGMLFPYWLLTLNPGIDHLLEVKAAEVRSSSMC